LIVENRLPGPAVIGGLENAAVHLRAVEDIGLRRNARDRARSTAAKWPNVSPAQQRGKVLLGRLSFYLQIAEQKGDQEERNRSQ
jgi:hypothetical protein